MSKPTQTPLFRKKPLIGITMHFDHFEEVKKGVRYHFIREEYGQAITRMGGEAIFIDDNIAPARAAQMCDGFVISGGEDINPSLYGEAQLGNAWLEPLERSRWELALVAEADIRKKPILGICYGNQLLNIHYGGTLYQDIATQIGAKDHGTSSSACMEPISFSESVLGFKKGSSQVVGHRHHQAVAKLGRGMRVVATADDGTIEAIAGNGHVGIQWHPEADGSADQVYGPFVQRCAKRAGRFALPQMGKRLRNTLRSTQ